MMHDSLVVYCRTQSRRNPQRFYGKAQKSWDQFDEGPSLNKIQVKLPHQRSPYAVKFEDRSQEERRVDKSDVPAETGGKWLKLS